ncbi:MAG: molybdate ABC transporter substrate-binding protein [Jatrophihabitans sp.]
MRSNAPARQMAVLAAVVTLLVALVGCSSSKKSDSGKVAGTITVFAAASLTGTFTELGKQFESAHPGVKVKFDFEASSALSTQITQGAGADVFASAATSNMDTVVKAGDAKDPKNFVKNVMEIAVPPSNPANITSLQDLAKPTVKVALCQAQVPCGKTALMVFTNAKITVKPVTEEKDVKTTLAKVSSNEVDAGVVYVTDVKAAGTAVKGIEIPADVNASTEYPIAALSHSKHSPTAQAFVDFVLSSAGQSVLTAAGFSAP